MNVFNFIRWQDILDMLLVSIVLYKLFLMLKGTRAMLMLLGLGLMLAMSILSKYLHLHTMDWLIQGFWAYIVIALIVLFQHEIKMALAKIGEAPFRRFTSAVELKSIDEIVKASVSLSARKIGALIVMERDTGLQDFIEIGIPLDARVSREIILSIFHPTSPIHDGAIVIKGNRIIAAGCFLPITLRSDLDKSMGTRHRAALAITEETDSVTLIVSEEIGGISIAVKGEIETRLDIIKVRDILTDLFTEDDKK